jgi:hypothetical protein
MLKALMFIAFLFAPAAVLAQATDPKAEAEIVRQTVGAIAGSNKRHAEVVLRDLREFEGKIIGVYDDSFVLQPKGDKKRQWTVISVGTNPNRSPAIHIRYGDVLQVEGKNAVASFVPDPAESPYASWDAVGTIGRGEFVQVYRTGGGRIQGVVYRSGPDSLSLMKGNREVVIPAGEIAKVYRVKGDTRSLATKVLSGGTRGMEITDDWLPLLDPRRMADPIVLMVGAALGTAIYVLPIGKTSRVLVYSR